MREVYGQLRYVGVISALLVAFMFLLFPAVAQFLYGEHGAAAVDTARILSFALSFNAVAMVFSYALLALRRDKATVVLTIVGVSLYLVLSVFLVPQHGALGAGTAMCLSYFAVIIIGYVLVRRFVSSAERGVSLVG
jgi:O-antigen/teichoic acid export membrane protein